MYCERDRERKEGKAPREERKERARERRGIDTE